MKIAYYTGPLGPGQVFDSREQAIAVVLTPQDRQNIANMDPEATIYCEFVPADGMVSRLDHGGGPVREFTPGEIERWMDSLKEAR